MPLVKIYNIHFLLSSETKIAGAVKIGAKGMPIISYTAPSVSLVCHLHLRCFCDQIVLWY